MRSAFEALRQSYDVVIVDLSSVLPLVDVCLTARFNDSYILVAELGGTTSGHSCARNRRQDYRQIDRRCLEQDENGSGAAVPAIGRDDRPVAALCSIRYTD